MRNTIRLTILFIIFFLSPAAVHAGIDAAARAKEIAPFLDSDTRWVIHLNVAEIELLSLEKWLLSFPPDAAPATDGARREIHDAMAELGRALGDFKKAGGRDLYLVLFGLPGESALIAPGGADGTADALRKLSRTALFNSLVMVMPAFDSRLEPVMIRNAAILAGDDRLGRIRKSSGIDPVELEAAFAAVPDSSMQMLLMTTPRLPREIAANNDTSLRLLAQVKWMAVGIKLPPRPSMDIVVQATGAASAQELTAPADRWAAMIRKESPGLELPRVDVRKDQLLITVEQERFNEFLSASIAAKRSEERCEASASNIRTILTFATMHATEHDGAWPADLRAVQANLSSYPFNRRLLRNPQQPDRRIGYIYLPPPPGSGGDKLVIYEAYDQWPGGVNAGFADGHVEWIASEDELKKRLPNR